MLVPPLGSWCPLLGEILDPPLCLLHPKRQLYGSLLLACEWQIHQTYPFFVSRVVLNKVRQILKRIAHLRSPYRRIRTFFALCKKFNSDMR